MDLAPLDDSSDPVADARAIVGELQRYDEELAAKPRWLVLNKLDLIAPEDRQACVDAFLAAYGETARCFTISAIDGNGCKPLIYEIQDHIDAHRNPALTDNAASDDSPAPYDPLAS